MNVINDKVDKAEGEAAPWKIFLQLHTPSKLHKYEVQKLWADKNGHAFKKFCHVRGYLGLKFLQTGLLLLPYETS